MGRASRKLSVHWPNEGRAQGVDELSTILSFIDETTERDWASGSGTFGLSCGDASLILSRNDALGFTVMFGKGRTWIPGDVILGAGSAEKISSVCVGGDPWRLPESFFVSAETVKEAIEYFCATGEKNPRLRWAAAGPLMSAAGL